MPGTGSCGRIAAITRAFRPEDSGEAGGSKTNKVRGSAGQGRLRRGPCRERRPERVYWLPYVEDGCRDPFLSVVEEEEEE